jgi:hypothetical protein
VVVAVGCCGLLWVVVVDVVIDADWISVVVK